MARLVKVAETKDVPLGTAIAVDVEGHTVALFNVKGTLYAIDNTCTHRGGPLPRGGERHGGTRPFHGARFDVTTGRFWPPALGESAATFESKAKTSRSRSPSCRSRADGSPVTRARQRADRVPARSATDVLPTDRWLHRQRGARGDPDLPWNGAALRLIVREWREMVEPVPALLRAHHRACPSLSRDRVQDQPSHSADAP
jgi:nitrite reductase/ring-hydroxylating ferredoxin subunit